MKITPVIFTSACIAKFRLDSTNPTQFLCQVVTKQKTCNQAFYVEMNRLAKFLDFICVDNFEKIVSDKTYYIKKGKYRIKAIIEVTHNSTFKINKLLRYST